MNKIFAIKESYENLVSQLSPLKEEIKRQTNLMNEVRNQGEISENSEFLEAKNTVDRIDKKIMEIEETLSNIHVLDVDAIETGNTVKFGSTVKLEYTEENKIKEYTILGPLEAEPEMGIISYQSPLGNELIGKKVGEEIILIIGENEIYIDIIEIS